jgi:hypothetical protein
MDIRPQGWKRFLLIPLFASLAGSLAITVPLLPELKGKAVGGFFIYFAFGLILTFPLSLVGSAGRPAHTPARRDQSHNVYVCRSIGRRHSARRACGV